MAEPSFIPKNLPQRFARAREPLGTFLFLGVLVLVISLLALGGLFFYERLLSGQITDLVKSLERLKADFDADSINELARVSESIQTAQEVLSSHRRASNIFMLLEASTLPEVRFSKFSFDAASGQLTLAAEAKSYTALAHQTEIFKKSSGVSKTSLSSFSLTPAGGVEYEVDLTLNPALVIAR